MIDESIVVMVAVERFVFGWRCGITPVVL